MSRRRFLAATLAGAAAACGGPPEPGVAEGPAGHPARLRARPGSPPARWLEPGIHPLGLERGRDGVVFVPEGAGSGPAPLLVMLHGAGGRASRETTELYERAGAAGVVVLAPESRGRTWDVIVDDFGPDVAFIDRALQHLFRRCRVDPARLALGGFSDGGTYALSLGLANGDLFRHLIAFSPGFFATVEPVGEPRVFVTHGTADAVLPIDRTSRRIVPRLRGFGYDVTYREFEGGHVVPAALVDEALVWFTA